jgi:hypothetical protein
MMFCSSKHLMVCFFEYSNNIDGWGLGQSVLTGHQGALPLVCLGSQEEAVANSIKKASDQLVGKPGKRTSSQSAQLRF